MASRLGFLGSVLDALRDRFASANRALEYLRSIGQGVRRQEFLRVWREGSGRYREEVRIRFVNFDKTPTDKVYAQKYFGTPDRYTYLVRATHRDPETGETWDTHTHVSLDYRGKKSEISERIRDMLNERAPREGDSSGHVESVTMLKAWVNPYASD